MASKGEGARRQRHDVRRNMERVLEAAQALFAERGAEVKMCEVAARAGVGVGTVYRRFPSKEHLFAAVSAAACADTSLGLEQAAASAASPAAKLRAVIVAQYRHSLHQAALLERSAADALPHESHQGIYPTLHALVADVIGAGQATGAFRPGDPALLAAMVLELLGPRTALRLSQLVEGCEGAADLVADFVLAGLAA